MRLKRPIPARALRTNKLVLQKGGEGIFHKLLRDPLIEFATKIMSLLSIIVLSFALSYDVGFFSALGLGTFTFFSLSEHVLFAVQALPLSFGLFAMGTMYVFGASLAMDIAERTSKKGKFKLIGVIFLIVVSISISFWVNLQFNFYFGDKIITMAFPGQYEPEMARHELFRPMLIGESVAAFLMLATPVIIMLFDSLYRYKTYIVFFGIYCSLFALSFTFGYSRAKDITIQKHSAEDQFLETKDSDKITARILRAGDKGLLLYDTETDQVVFMKWDNLDEVRGVQKLNSKIQKNNSQN
jgi:hypothetical protein